MNAEQLSELAELVEELDAALARHPEIEVTIYTGSVQMECDGRREVYNLTTSSGTIRVEESQ